jgi:hypothetical protein
MRIPSKQTGLIYGEGVRQAINVANAAATKAEVARNPPPAYSAQSERRFHLIVNRR